MRIGFTTDAEVELLDWAKHHGFGSIEWMRFNQSFAAPGQERWREGAARFGAEAGARDMRISAIGAYYRNPLDPAQIESARAVLHRAIEVAELLGIKTVAGFPGAVIQTTLDSRGGNPVYQPMENFLPQVLAFWEPIAQYAADHGVRLAFEHCPQGAFHLPVMHYNLFGQPAMWERFFSATRCANIGLEWDAAHLICQFVDPVENLRKYGSKIFHVHAKDAFINHQLLATYGPCHPGVAGTSVARLRAGELVGNHSRAGSRRLRFRPEHRRLARPGFQGSPNGGKVPARWQAARTRRLAAGQAVAGAVCPEGTLTHLSPPRYIRHMKSLLCWLASTAIFLSAPPLRATIMVPLAVGELTERAELILHGTVTSKVCLKDPEGNIITRMDFNVSEVWKGNLSTNRFTLIHGGGTVGDLRTVVDGQAEYEVGEEVVVFVRLNPRGEGVTIGLAQGKFQVWKEDATGAKFAHNLFHGRPKIPESSPQTAMRRAAGKTDPARFAGTSATH